MEDLLQSQIKKSCDLAVPNGLKELMWDISREVLRAHPQDIYNFITNYLSVLLVTRENLTIAAKVCDETCHAPCQLALEDKLRDIGLSNEDVDTAKEIITEHLQGAVNETNILLKLMRKTNIDEHMLPAVQQAIRSAFVQHHANKANMFEPSSDYEDEVTEAANHTLRLYENASPTSEEYNRMAKRIQAAYQAYGVRRAMCIKKNEFNEKASEIKEKRLKIKEEHVHVEIKEPEKPKSPRNKRASFTTESSSSLAGSYVKLPKYKPYSAHDVHAHDYEEILQKMHSSTDFIEDINKEQEQATHHYEKKDAKKVISFEALTIEDDILLADDESEGTVEEAIHVEEVDDEISEIHDINEVEGCDDYGSKVA